MDTVIEIGCGTGKITAEVNKCVSIKQLIAIDIEKDMTEYAKSKYNRDNITFLVQNFCVEWNQLRVELKQLEGKVDLVYSCYAFQWLFNKKEAVKNIYRLLSPQGKAYAEVVDLFVKFSPPERIKYNHIIRIPSFAEQVKTWQNEIKDANFTKLHIHCYERELNHRTSFDEFIRGNKMYLS